MYSSGLYSGLDHVKSEKKFFTVKELINKNPEMYANLKKITACWIAFKERKLYKTVLKKYRESQNYFTAEELYETIPKSEKRKISELQPWKGSYVYQSKAVFSGSWLGGFRHGEGVMTWADGAIFQGAWIYGFADGPGVLKYPNGDIMKGNFRYNKLNGQGEMHNSETGYNYYGNLENDLQSGLGRETWADKSSYDGQYDLGKKEGVGKYLWNDGTFYIGEWKDNKIHGWGIYKWSEGRKYIGEWKNSKMNGYGMYIWCDGRKYVGEYKDDKKNNFGIYSDMTGKKYEGYWKNGFKEGFGKYTKNNGSFKIGFWENNQWEQMIVDNKVTETKLPEIENRVVETNKNVNSVFQTIKVLIERTMPNELDEILGLCSEEIGS